MLGVDVNSIRYLRLWKMLFVIQYIHVETPITPQTNDRNDQRASLSPNVKHSRHHN